MTTTIQVSRGLCAPMRDDVLTALKPFGVKLLAFDCWGEGHYSMPVPPLVRLPDSDIWVRKHIARVTVSDAQAAWAERLLWQSRKVWLDTPALNPRLEWSAPADCKAGAHGTLGRGTMPTPWSTQKRQPRAKRTRRSRQQEQRQEQRQDGGLLSASGCLLVFAGMLVVTGQLLGLTPLGNVMADDASGLGVGIIGAGLVAAMIVTFFVAIFMKRIKQ